MKTGIVRWIVGLVCACLLVGMAISASAQTEDFDPIYRPITRINVEDADVINATLDRPDVMPIPGTGKIKHLSLIRLRENFQNKIIRSAGDL